MPMDGTRKIVNTRSTIIREELQNVSIEINRYGEGRVTTHSEKILYHSRRVDSVTVYLSPNQHGAGITEDMVREELARLHQCLPEDIVLKPYVSISKGINV